ncbi:hypothetical protein [Nonomuraea polychroma]|uniref:hypothetical protein n=1 Tax=Nonomuraea polychroma TaxID=46176 RepID=UPI000FDE9849|nr:hypothetical protein [Nonomuraea polychroma]
MSHDIVQNAFQALPGNDPDRIATLLTEGFLPPVSLPTPACAALRCAVPRHVPSCVEPPLARRLGPEVLVWAGRGLAWSWRVGRGPASGLGAFSARTPP